MSEHSKEFLSAKLIQLNQEGVDLVKDQERKFKRFISNLGKTSPIEPPPKKTVFTPTYCSTCLNHANLKNEPLILERQASKKSLDKAFDGVKEVYFSGGGGAGCAYPSAVKYASDFGLDLSKVEVSCGASVGAIMALGVALEVKAEDLQPLLAGMPTASFQDWSVWNFITKFSTTWGICRGQSMPSYFRQLIKDRTGLDDPTFKELHDAGFKKELRITSTNVSTGEIDVFSYKTKPDIKVAETVALSCFIPAVFPAIRIMNTEGKFDIHTDGGFIQNFPWGIGAKKVVPNEQRLGFVLVNSFSKAQRKNITTFFEYIYNLFILNMFQRPLSLTEEQRQRTVTIELNHNPIDFTPDPPQLKYLEESSYKAVKTLAEQICETSQSPTPPPSPSKPSFKIKK